MKSMNIAASRTGIPTFYHRRVVALGDTDFTDVAAVVITAADSRSGILALRLSATGFHLPVFLYSNMLLNYPRRYGGNQRQRAAVAGAGIRSLSV